VQLRQEVVEVEGDDQLRVSGDGGGEEVPVLLVVARFEGRATDLN
jgi:hypothetical protein